MRYIEIDSIIEQIKAEHCERCTNHRCALCDIDEVLILLEEADDADVEEVKHGYWDGHKCSICRELNPTMYLDECDLEYCSKETLYCPNCGAKMDERKGE